jgi:hypothetical protein
LNPFSNKKYNFQEIGSYYLFKSEQLNMQAFQSRLGREKRKDVSWNEKFAIRYGTTAYVLIIADKKLEATQVSPTKDDNELEVIQTDKKGKSFEITLGDGTGKVVITTDGNRIDIVITLCPDRYPEATGLCFGLDDGKTPCPAADDMFKGNCKIPTIKFQNSLRKCLLTPACEPYVPAPVAVSAVLPTNTTLPSPKPPLKPGCVRITEYKKYEPTKVYNNATVKEYEEVAPEVATQRCDALIKDYKIPSVDRDFYVKACAFDYSTGGDVGCAETYRKTYNSDCGTILDFQGQSPDPEERKYATEVAADYGLGLDSVCEEAKCGVNGYCSGSACSCNEGYLGNKCEWSFDSPEQIQASSSVKIVVSSFAAFVIFVLVA